MKHDAEGFKMKKDIIFSYWILEKRSNFVSNEYSLVLIINICNSEKM